MLLVITLNHIRLQCAAQWVSGFSVFPVDTDRRHGYWWTHWLGSNLWPFGEASDFLSALLSINTGCLQSQMAWEYFHCTYRVVSSDCSSWKGSKMRLQHALLLSLSLCKHLRRKQPWYLICCFHILFSLCRSAACLVLMSSGFCCYLAHISFGERCVYRPLKISSVLPAKFLFVLSTLVIYLFSFHFF